MSLQNWTNSNQFANEMQTDEETRRGVAQWFGDPQARSFLQESGDIKSAVAHVDAGVHPGDVNAGMPNFVDTGDGMTKGFNAPAATPAAAAPGVPAPQWNTVEQPRPPAPAYEPGTDLKNVDLSSGLAVPQRPKNDLDSMTPGRKALMLAFMGLTKFGGSLAGQQHTYADDLLGRNLQQRQAQSDYDMNYPTMMEGLRRGAQDRSLDLRGKSAAVDRTEAETADIRNNGGPRGLARTANLRDFYTKAQTAWSTDPRFRGNPASFKRAMEASGVGLQIDPAVMEDIMGQPQNSTKWKVNEQGGVPTGLIDTQTNKIYGPNDVKGLNDPEASSLWDQAQAGHKQGQSEKISAAYAMGAARGAGQYTTIYHKQSGQTIRVDNAEAERLTKGPSAEYTSNGALFEKGRQKWANVFDVDAAKANVMAALPKSPIDLDEVARIDAAMQETHGTLSSVAKAALLKGLTPEGSKVATTLLSLRDQVVGLIGAMGMQASDTRAQALFNALPTASDLYNPYLAADKMDQVARMIDNVSQGLPGTAGNYGVGAGHGGRLNQGQGGEAAVPTRRNKKTGEVQQQINGVWTSVQTQGAKPKYKARTVDLSKGQL
jgi:hypothetical protein